MAMETALDMTRRGCLSQASEEQGVQIRTGQTARVPPALRYKLGHNPYKQSAFRQL
jgi:hypothetical protein